ncbi:hypothetical protein WN943_007897 [Citrus x changshan-huyou]
MTFSRASLITSLSVTESLSLMSPPCALLPPISIAFCLLHPSSCYRQKLFALGPHRRRQNVDARFRFSSFYDQDLCSINFVTTRRSPRQASSPEVPAYTDKSEYAGCFPGANPPTLKSDMKASSESQSSALFETVWDSNCCVMGKTWDLACYATVQGKAWLPRLCETLRVTPRFWGKCGCHGSVRSCVLRRGSGESVAVVPRFSNWPRGRQHRGRAGCFCSCSSTRQALTEHTGSQNSAIRCLLVIPGPFDAFVPNRDFNVWRYINEGETSLINNDGQRVLTFNGYTTALAMLTGSRLLIW